MKEFYIVDSVSNRIIQAMDFKPLVISANNGKQALQKFIRNHCMNSGMYEYHKDLFIKEWNCSTTYGSYFKAIML